MHKKTENSCRPIPLICVDKKLEEIKEDGLPLNPINMYIRLGMH